MNYLSSEKIKDAAEKFGTPMYIYDTDAFAARLSLIKKRLGRATLTFSMKANPFLTSVAADHVERIEVCSFGEFEIVRDLKIPPEKLLISGVLKKRCDLHEIVDHCRDKALYTAESPAQIRFLQTEGEEYGLDLHVLLRLSSGNQFGMDRDTISDVIRERSKYKNLYFEGLHFFSGTQKKNLKKTAREIKELDDLVSELSSYGYETSMIEYGTGFDVPVFTDQDEGPTEADSMEEFRALIDGMKYRGHFTVEMGRALAFSCGSYITSVMDLKKTGKINYCITDGGIHQIHYDGQFKGMYQPIMDVIRRGRAGADGVEDYTVCGSLCTVNDILAANFKTKPLTTGDILVFRNVGAYSLNEGMSTFLSHEMPAIVMYSEADGTKLARSMRESYRLNMADIVY